MKSSNSLLVFKQCSVLFNTNRIRLSKALAHGMAVNFLVVLIFVIFVIDLAITKIHSAGAIESVQEQFKDGKNSRKYGIVGNIHRNKIFTKIAICFH